jgi:hypothetical protein
MGGSTDLELCGSTQTVALHARRAAGPRLLRDRVCGRAVPREHREEKRRGGLAHDAGNVSTTSRQHGCNTGGDGCEGWARLRGFMIRDEARTPPPLVLSGHAASLTPY